MADGPGGTGGGDGIHRAVLEAGMAGAGKTVPPASGASPFQPRTEGAQAGFRGRRTAGAAAPGGGTDPKLRAGRATAVVAHHDTHQTAVDARPGAAAEPVGGLSGGVADQ